MILIGCESFTDTVLTIGVNPLEDSVNFWGESFRRSVLTNVLNPLEDMVLTFVSSALTFRLSDPEKAVLLSG